ncbi:hypothetical protein ILUMI_10150, partial [Ignelater luminosus]
MGPQPPAVKIHHIRSDLPVYSTEGSKKTYKRIDNDGEEESLDRRHEKIGLKQRVGRDVLLNYQDSFFRLTDYRTWQTHRSIGRRLRPPGQEINRSYEKYRTRALNKRNRDALRDQIKYETKLMVYTKKINDMIAMMKELMIEIRNVKSGQWEYMEHIKEIKEENEIMKKAIKELRSYDGAPADCGQRAGFRPQPGTYVPGRGPRRDRGENDHRVVACFHRAPTRLHGTDPPDRWRGRPRTRGGLAPVMHSELAQICDKRRVGHGPARPPPSGHQGPHSCEKPGATPGPAHYESGSPRQSKRSRSRSP